MSPKIKSTENSKLEEIINAAQKRFGHYGLTKTTMNEIALDIGMPKACLYYYFQDKENIFEAVIKKEQDQFIVSVNKLIKSSSVGPLLLKQYFKMRLFYFQRFVNLAKLKSDFFINKPIYARMFNDFRKKEIELVNSIIQIGIEGKQFRNVNSQEYSKFLISLIQGIRMVAMRNNEVEEFNEEDYASMEKTMNKVVRMFIKDIQVD